MINDYCKVVVVPIVVSALFAAGCTLGGGEENTFATFDDAKDANAIGNWLPSWLPENATNIRERHRIDLPVAWVRYEIPKGDNSGEVPVSDHCVSATDEDLKVASELSDEVPKWWPNELRSFSLQSTGTTEWSLRKCGGDLLALSVLDNVTEAYVWRLAGEFTRNANE